MASKKELIKKIEELENRLEVYRSLDGYIEFGILTVEVPLSLPIEKQKVLLETAQNTLQEGLDSIGVDIKIIALSNVAKSFEIFNVDKKKEESK